MRLFLPTLLKLARISELGRLTHVGPETDDRPTDSYLSAAAFIALVAAAIAMGRSRTIQKKQLPPAGLGPLRLERRFLPSLMSTLPPLMGKSAPIWAISGGQRGIRTPDTLVTYTRFPGVRLQPLGHLSGMNFRMSPSNSAIGKVSRAF